MQQRQKIAVADGALDHLFRIHHSLLKDIWEVFWPGMAIVIRHLRGHESA